MAFGTVQIRYAQPGKAIKLQLIGLGIGLVAMILVAVTDYRRLLNISRPFMFLAGAGGGLIPTVGLKIIQRLIKSPALAVSTISLSMFDRHDAGLVWQHRTPALRVPEMAVGVLILAPAS